MRVLVPEWIFVCLHGTGETKFRKKIRTTKNNCGVPFGKLAGNTGNCNMLRHQLPKGNGLVFNSHSQLLQTVSCLFCQDLLFATELSQNIVIYFLSLDVSSETWSGF